MLLGATLWLGRTPTRSPIDTPRARFLSWARGVRYDSHMVELNVITKQLRGPLTTTGSGLVTWAKIFVYDGRFYVAESRSRGKVVTSVTEYPMPEGVPDHGRRVWGEWRWQTCGCGNSWRLHSNESLVAQARPIESVSVVSEADGLTPPDGPLEGRLEWISESDDMAERKARAEAVYQYESEAGSQLDTLDAVLDAAVYADSVTVPDPTDEG